MEKKKKEDKNSRINKICNEPNFLDIYIWKMLCTHHPIHELHLQHPYDQQTQQKHNPVVSEQPKH